MSAASLYLNRLAALATDRMWIDGHPERWFAGMRQRPTFAPAFQDWMPAELPEKGVLQGVSETLAAAIGLLIDSTHVRAHRSAIEDGQAAAPAHITLTTQAMNDQAAAAERMKGIATGIWTRPVASDNGAILPRLRQPRLSSPVAALLFTMAQSLGVTIIICTFWK